MKACILSTVDMSRMTMASIYTDYFDKNGIEYDYIYVDKFKDPIMGSPTMIYPYSAEGFENAAFVPKLLHYWKMRKFATQLFKQRDYDFLVVWGSLTAFIFADIIKKFLCNKCCINIRDFFYNDNWLMNKWLSVAMNNATFNTVSSDALIPYLPGKKFIAIHSLNESLLYSLTPRKKLRDKKEPLRIMYIGWIGRLEYVYKIIDDLKDDTRFELYFIGMGAEDVDKYIEGKNICNVRTHGKFPPQDTSMYLENADIIYNLYGFGSKHFDIALSIKLYYAIYMHIPLLGFKGTYTLETAQKCGIGFEVNPTNFYGLGDRLYSFYHGLDQREISEKCDQYIDSIRDNNERLRIELDAILMA